MLMNYLKMAFRNIIKRKGYTFLNIAGLTIGMTCCLLIFHYVSYEKSYETFNKEADNIVRLRLDNYQKGQLAWKSATVYPGIGPAMKRDFPEVERFCRLHDAEGLFTNLQTNVRFNETKGYFADPDALHILGINLLKGSAVDALNGPDKMVITESMARKYFRDEEPVGKRLGVKAIGLLQSYEVTGVIQDYPSNAHLDIQYLVSYKTLGKIARNQWGDTTNESETSFGWYDFYTYLQLKPGTDLQQFETKFPAFCDRYMNNSEYNRTNNRKQELYLLPLRDVHLLSNVNQEAEVNGNGQAVSFLFLVAIFIIGIAWINYINLSTARSVERAREVGVRKVMGALRSNLISQFLIESLLLNMLALFLSLGLFLLLRPLFDQFIGKENMPIGITPYYWRLFFLLFLSGTLLSGVYPAFVLSGFQPITVLKGVFKNSIGGLVLRKGLITVQFMTSVVLIAGTIIVYQQVNFMRKQKLGVDIDRTIVLQGSTATLDSLYTGTFQPFKTELLQQPGIRNVTASTSVMSDEIYWTNSFVRVGPDNPTSVTLYILGVDEDFIPSYDLKLVAGRNYSNRYGTDNKAIVLNEKAVELLGFANNTVAIGGKVRRGRDTLTVIGVATNYHHQGLQKAIEPMAMLPWEAREFYSVKVSSGNVTSTLSAIERSWHKYFPADPFSYSFLDESFGQQYKADMLFGKVFAVFAFLAIFIACMGLLGLSAYNVLQRTKEIGVRKVLGASTQTIILLLSRDFLKLVLLALVLAIPVGWYLMHSWLQDFAYRIGINWWVFGLAGLLAVLIALVTIILQSIKKVVESPVKSLRTE